MDMSAQKLMDVSTIDEDGLDSLHHQYNKLVIDDMVKGRPFSFDAIQIVLPVTWGKLSKYTFDWYNNFIHKSSYYLNVCHMPDFRAKIRLGMCAPEVLETMREVEVKSLELKRYYETLMEEKKIHGRFIRISGNTVWASIMEFCRLVHPTMIVMGSKTVALPMKSVAPDIGPIKKGQASLVSNVTSDVLMHSSIPVITVRMPSPEETIKEENSGTNLPPTAKQSKKMLKKFSTSS
ncbi:uncharacterized protein LOC106075359 isoform X1 [Biomphalaria glabrata]|uniref:Uncharacterized protein LOC106075359 isoform X1 n=2 Tax=Biomphalaria glabrata TaxID=6526 RepID=A0A9W3A3Q9_BIOGL|nr:uncharacterized protein LOC106075359 isoform X1 [Biomphalaria glabrata]